MEIDKEKWLEFIQEDIGLPFEIFPHNKKMTGHQRKTPLTMWTVYANPSDYPGKFVARKFHVTNKVMPTDDIIVAESLGHVRALLPKGLFCLTRNAADDGPIVESWI